LTRRNYLDTRNPFGLAAPPAWFLQALAVFDAELVLFPSTVEPLYRLARRVTKTPGIQKLTTVMPERATDTRLCIQHRLVPVTNLYPQPQWGPHIFAELRRRDLWAHGGADKACDLLEQHEAAQAAALDRAMQDELDRRGTSAYFGLQARLGTRTFVHT
jgi:hypothetical protein